MKNSHPKLCCVLSFLAASLFITAAGFIDSAFAQSAAATLSGTVTDEQGVVVPGVTVTVTDAAKAKQRQVTNNGYFIVSQLPLSRYAVNEASLEPDTNDR
ncbi:MAG TPA: carboxypeptidase regulatory-like domain-containing protein [Blastocatellia bacterium]|jgi:hypothetical protein